MRQCGAQHGRQLWIAVVTDLERSRVVGAVIGPEHWVPRSRKAPWEGAGLTRWNGVALTTFTVYRAE